MTSKIAIVTGGSRGIGRNIVESLARRGVDTIFTYHTHAADAETVSAEAATAKAVALQLDTGDVASFDAFVGSVKDALAKLGATRFDFLSITRATITATCRSRRLPCKNSTVSTTSISKACSS